MTLKSIHANPSNQHLSFVLYWPRNKARPAYKLARLIVLSRAVNSIGIGFKNTNTHLHILKRLRASKSQSAECRGTAHSSFELSKFDGGVFWIPPRIAMARQWLGNGVKRLIWNRLNNQLRAGMPRPPPPACHTNHWPPIARRTLASATTNCKSSSRAARSQKREAEEE